MYSHKKVIHACYRKRLLYLTVLKRRNAGYGSVQKVSELTNNEIVLSPETMYGSLS